MMNPQLIPGSELSTPAYHEFRESVGVTGLHWSAEETQAAWLLFKVGAVKDGPGDDDEDGCPNDDDEGEEEFEDDID